MQPVKEETPAEVVPPPTGIRPGPVLAVVLVVLAIVAVALYVTRTRRPAASPAAATPVPETIEMAREAAQREVAKQTEALRERLAGEILGPTPGAKAQPAAAKQPPAQQAQAAAPKPTTAAAQQPAAQPAAAKQPPAQQVPAQAQPAAAKPTAAPAAAPEPTTAPPEPEPTQVPPTPVPTAAAPAVAAPKAPPTPVPVQVGDLVEAGPDVVPPQAISKTPPTYPALAARQRLAGVVTMDVLVDENGNVQDVKVVKGIKPDLGLDAAAVSAVKTWRFRPATKNGVRVKVHIALTTTFKL
jgi:TonB family protein